MLHALALAAAIGLRLVAAAHADEMPAQPFSCLGAPTATLVPVSVSLYCSNSWLFRGQCVDGHDMVYDWKIEGQTNSGDWHITPWGDQAVILRGIELTVMEGPTPEWLMAGNDVIGDAMLFLAGGRHGRHDFPQNSGMPVPKKAEAKPSEYFDLHGVCAAAPWYWPFPRHPTLRVMYTLYYTAP